jgi:hypothetical protein
MRRLTFGIGLLFLLASGAILNADVTVGNYQSGDCLPFNCNLDQTASSPLDFQEVYSSTAFPGTTTITSLAWYFAAAQGGTPTMLPGTYNVFLCYTNAPVNGLSDNLASNRGADYSFFATFSGGKNLFPSFTIGGVPFVFKPNNGNLLVEIFAAGQPYQPNNGKFGFEEADFSGSVVSRAAATPNFDYGPFHVGLVTTFGTGTPTPEPGTLAMFGSGIFGLAGILRRKINL